MDAENEYDPLEHQCIWCGKYASRLFCSNTCRRKYEKEDMDGAIPVADCGICGAEFEMHNGNQKYCCMDCSRIALFIRRPLLGSKFLARFPEYTDVYAQFGIYPALPKSSIVRPLPKPRRPKVNRSKHTKVITPDKPLTDRQLNKWNNLKYRILYVDKTYK